MTRVFAGERTFLSPVLRPLERAIYWVCGVEEKIEQHWTIYAAAGLIFSFAGFLALYALQRLQTVLPFNPQPMDAISPASSLNTSISFVTTTNSQSYVPKPPFSSL